MFGASFSYTEPNHTGNHDECVFESFYRVRLTQNVGLGPDLEASVHPTYATKAYMRSFSETAVHA